MAILPLSYSCGCTTAERMLQSGSWTTALFGGKWSGKMRRLQGIVIFLVWKQLGSWVVTYGGSKTSISAAAGEAARSAWVVMGLKACEGHGDWCSLWCCVSEAVSEVLC